MKITKRIGKTLSSNDVGETGGHQAGILVPKSPDILGFFPTLTSNTKNPRASLHFFEEDGITKWPFEFIYYNNKFYGGTRNEYRLTKMTRYLRASNAKPGDFLELLLDADGRRHIHLKREEAETADEVLRVSSGWKIIQL